MYLKMKTVMNLKVKKKICRAVRCKAIIVPRWPDKTPYHDIKTQSVF